MQHTTHQLDNNQLKECLTCTKPVLKYQIVRHSERALAKMHTIVSKVCTKYRPLSACTGQHYKA